MGGRLNLITKAFLKDNIESVVSVLQEFLVSYPGIEVAVIDRGTPYLNDEVKKLLEKHGRFRIVCPPETPTAKAACERHFFTLKDLLRKAIYTVFSKDPQWKPEQIVKFLELGAIIFSSLYHQIPQEGIDGKSPAERILDFNPVKACAQQVKLFERSMNSEPSEEYARHIHKLFQFAWAEKDTVNKFRLFSTRTLRKLVEQEKKVMGPPFADTIYDPLGFLAARAKEIRNKERKTFYVEKWLQAEEKRKQEIQKNEKKFEEEHPEQFVDGMLRTLVVSVKNGHAVLISIRFMRETLQRLKDKMKGFFNHEFLQLVHKVDKFTNDVFVRSEVKRILDKINAEIQVCDAKSG